MAEIDSKSMMLWGENGALGGHVKVHLRGSGQASVVEATFTYIGLQNTDYWLARMRDELEAIFKDDLKSAMIPEPKNEASTTKAEIE